MSKAKDFLKDKGIVSGLGDDILIEVPNQLTTLSVILEEYELYLNISNVKENELDRMKQRNEFREKNIASWCIAMFLAACMCIVLIAVVGIIGRQF